MWEKAAREWKRHDPLGRCVHVVCHGAQGKEARGKEQTRVRSVRRRVYDVCWDTNAPKTAPTLCVCLSARPPGSQWKWPPNIPSASAPVWSMKSS